MNWWILSFSFFYLHIPCLSFHSFSPLRFSSYFSFPNFFSSLLSFPCLLSPHPLSFSLLFSRLFLSRHLSSPFLFFPLLSLSLSLTISNSFLYFIFNFLPPFLSFIISFIGINIKSIMFSGKCHVITKTIQSIFNIYIHLP